MENNSDQHHTTGKIFCICIHNADSNGQVWDVVLMPNAIIGRDEICHIQLYDKSVSRQHCRIYHDGITMIENVSKTNIAKLNGIVLSTPTVLEHGDKIECGRTTLIVDSIYCSDTDESEVQRSGTYYIDI